MLRQGNQITALVLSSSRPGASSSAGGGGSSDLRRLRLRPLPLAERSRLRSRRRRSRLRLRRCFSFLSRSRLRARSLSIIERLSPSGLRLLSLSFDDFDALPRSSRAFLASARIRSRDVIKLLPLASKSRLSWVLAGASRQSARRHTPS